MRIRLAYDKTGLWIELPDDLDVTVVEPAFVPGLPDPAAALRAALAAPIAATPLRELVRPGERVGVIFSDITRPTPNRLILPTVLAELSRVPGVEVTLFNALGTHRSNTDAELRDMLGDEIVERYPIVQNNAFDPTTQVRVGVTSRGHEVWLNAQLMACDLKVLTGFIEPHFFAGFSGGGKAIMPGMAGLRTVLGNHDARMIADPRATWGVTEGNPIWEEIQEVAQQAGRLFLVNVTLNREKQITGVFAGDLRAAHAAGCSFARRAAMAAVPQPFDIVITTNSGYPLDLNLYQAVKGMSAAAQVVRPGGAIIIAASCWDGIPDHGLYGRLLREAASPQELLERINAPGFLEQDQWEAQIQAQIQLQAEVYVRSHNLTDEQITAALLRPCHRIEDTVAELLQRYGRRARICVLPEGPQTIPYIQG
ncbi:MAG: nickel-dependent lactate racemase [Anaerolineae bacterium]